MYSNIFIVLALFWCRKTCSCIEVKKYKNADYIADDNYSGSWKRRNLSKFYEESPICSLPLKQRVELIKDVFSLDDLKIKKLTHTLIVKLKEDNEKLKDTVDLVKEPKCDKVKIASLMSYFSDQGIHAATGKRGQPNEGTKYYLTWDDNDGVYVHQSVKGDAKVLSVYRVVGLGSKFPTLKKDELGLRKRIKQKYSKKKEQPKN